MGNPNKSGILLLLGMAFLLSMASSTQTTNQQALLGAPLAMATTSSGVITDSVKDLHCIASGDDESTGTAFSYLPTFDVYQCVGYQFVGRYANGGSITASYQLASHVALKVTFKLAVLDKWEDDSFTVSADGVPVYSQKYHYQDPQRSELCGADCYSDYIDTITIGINHTNTSLTLSFSSSLNSNNVNEQSWGICDLEIKILQYPVYKNGDSLEHVVFNNLNVFSCSSSSMTVSDNWMISTFQSSYQSSFQCSGYNFFGSFGALDRLQSLYTIASEHQSISVSFKMAMLESWQAAGMRFAADGSAVLNQVFNRHEGDNELFGFGTGAESLCGAEHPNSIATDFFAEFDHSSTSISFTIDTIGNLFTQQNWGICDLVINVNQCPLGTFYDGSGCVSQCPAGTYPSRIRRDCQPCTPDRCATGMEFKDIECASTFHSSDLASWSIEGSRTVINHGYDTETGSSYLGIFGKDTTITKSLYSLPEHTAVTIKYTVFAFNTWDSDESVVLIADGKSVLQTYWSPAEFDQSLDTLECGKDAYKTVTKKIDHTEQQITLQFTSTVEGSHGEGWAICGLELIFENNPTPSTESETPPTESENPTESETETTTPPTESENPTESETETTTPPTESETETTTPPTESENPTESETETTTPPTESENPTESETETTTPPTESETETTTPPTESETETTTPPTESETETTTPPTESENPTESETETTTPPTESENPTESETETSTPPTESETETTTPPTESENPTESETETTTPPTESENPTESETETTTPPTESENPTESETETTTPPTESENPTESETETTTPPTESETESENPTESEIPTESETETTTPPTESENPTESETETTTPPTESENPTESETETTTPPTETETESETPTESEIPTESETETTTPPTESENPTESETETTTPPTETETESENPTESETETTTPPTESENPTESETETTTPPTETETESETPTESEIPTESETETTTPPTESENPTESETETTTPPTETETESENPTESETETTTPPTESETETTTPPTESETETTTPPTESENPTETETETGPNTPPTNNTNPNPPTTPGNSYWFWYYSFTFEWLVVIKSVVIEIIHGVRWIEVNDEGNHNCYGNSVGSSMITAYTFTFTDSHTWACVGFVESANGLSALPLDSEYRTQSMVICSDNTFYGGIIQAKPTTIAPGKTFTISVDLVAKKFEIREVGGENGLFTGTFTNANWLYYTIQFKDQGTISFDPIVQHAVPATENFDWVYLNAHQNIQVDSAVAQVRAVSDKYMNLFGDDFNLNANCAFEFKFREIGQWACVGFVEVAPGTIDNMPLNQNIKDNSHVLCYDGTQFMTSPSLTLTAGTPVTTESSWTVEVDSTGDSQEGTITFSSDNGVVYSAVFNRANELHSTVQFALDGVIQFTPTMVDPEIGCPQIQQNGTVLVGNSNQDAVYSNEYYDLSWIMGLSSEEVTANPATGQVGCTGSGTHNMIGQTFTEVRVTSFTFTMLYSMSWTCMGFVEKSSVSLLDINQDLRAQSLSICSDGSLNGLTKLAGSGDVQSAGVSIGVSFSVSVNVQEQSVVFRQIGGDSIYVGYYESEANLHYSAQYNDVGAIQFGSEIGHLGDDPLTTSPPPSSVVPETMYGLEPAGYNFDFSWLNPHDDPSLIFDSAYAKVVNPNEAVITSIGETFNEALIAGFDFTFLGGNSGAPACVGFIDEGANDKVISLCSDGTTNGVTPVTAAAIHIGSNFLVSIDPNANTINFKQIGGAGEFAASYSSNDDLRYFVSFGGSGAVEFGPSLRYARLAP